MFELFKGFVFALVMQVNSCTRMLGMCSRVLFEMFIFAKMMKVHSLNKVVQDEVYFAKDCACNGKGFALRYLAIGDST